MSALANESPFEQKELDKKVLRIKLKNRLIWWKCLDCEYVFQAKAQRQRCPVCKSTNLGSRDDKINTAITKESIEVEKVPDAKSVVSRSKS